MSHQYPDMANCADCGSAAEPGASCKECFDALLAFEFEHPVAFGAVHHLTVTSFYLQHPRGYSLDALGAWRTVLVESPDEKRAPTEIMKAMSARFEGATRVRDRAASAPEWWPASWPITVRDVLNPNHDLPTVEEYVARAREWAAAVRKGLPDELNGSGRQV